MANFDKAYKRLLKYEGVYSNHPKDKGGETFKGISRTYFPSWSGWHIVDYFKDKYPNTFIERLNTHENINYLVKSHYKKIFWNSFSCDSINDQKVANELFESSINIGVTRTTKFLQKSLNLLNRDQSLYEDIAEDGLFGKNTKKAMDACLSNRKDRRYLFNLLNIFQGCRYVDIGNETFIRGWINRIKIRKK